jgi:hypothetical protein
MLHLCDDMASAARSIGSFEATTTALDVCQDVNYVLRVHGADEVVRKSLTKSITALAKETVYC